MLQSTLFVVLYTCTLQKKKGGQIMGQRTQILLQTVDKQGQVQNRIFHEQWGYGKVMPMELLNLLTNLYSSDFRRTHSIHTLTIPNSYEITHESSYYSRIHITEDNTPIIQDTNDNYFYIVNTDTVYSEDTDLLSSVKTTPILSWDFSITPTNIRYFMGDNNDGMMFICIRETDWDYQYPQVTVTFVTEEQCDNRRLTGEQYMKRWEGTPKYCEEFVQAYNLFMKIFNVTELSEYSNEEDNEDSDSTITTVMTRYFDNDKNIVSLEVQPHTEFNVSTVKSTSTRRKN